MGIKQKIVFEVHMADDSSKKRARKIVALTEGLISMAIDASKNQLVLVGVGIDVAILATKLRKKVGRTTILSVEEVKSAEKIKEEEAAKKKKEEEEKKKKQEEEKKKQEEAAKKKQAEEAAKSRNIVPWSYNQYAPRHGYDLVHYGAPRYENSWFSW